MKYKDNRTPLINWIYDNIDGSLIKHFKDNNEGKRMPDIDPFTVMAIINRRITRNKKIELCKQFKSFLNISTPVPQDFSGVPEMNNQRSNFIGFEHRRKEGDIERLWKVFEDAVLDRDIEKSYDALNGQFLIRYILSMGLFWIRPDKFLALDGHNRPILEKLGIASFDGRFVPYKDYKAIMERLDAKISSGELGCSNYAEFSHEAYVQNDGASTRDIAKEPAPIKYGKSYWIYSPGENASKWQECQEEGLMCIGWDKLGDLSEYDSREEVRSEIKNYYPTDGNAKNDSLAVWQFANEMKPGDIVFAKKGLTKIIGRGVVQSDYVYDENRDDFKHIRKVEWTHVGEWVSTEQSAMKTLTNITKYKDYVERLNELIVGTETAKNMRNNNYDEFIKLLKGNYNLILTGAPGTGKTYMARTIAEEMGAEWKLVQFHPSYDYTDFVEGLRPIKEGVTLGFQRKDGVFKEFCKEAIKNLEDSKKTKDELEEEKSFTDKYNELIDKIEEGEINELELRTGVKMKIVKVSDYNNIILRSLETDSERTYTVSFDRLMKLAKAFPSARYFNRISNISEEIRNVIGGCNASAYWAVLNELYKYEREDISYLANVPDRMTATYVTQSPNVVRRKPFVFIIDEINRGEISKIFGELFFSIDAGYRGEKGRVETQYQNLVPEEDVFSKGFYIPENVYIIGTMNDIDRSVESMDFAMRRRFAWKEITAKSRQSMLDDDEAWGANGKPSDSVIAEMKNRMDNLNAAIIDQYGEEEYSNKDKIGLSKAYQIGAAYFLKYALYNNFEELWTNHLEGLLYEYLRGKTNVEEKIERLHQAYNDTTKY